MATATELPINTSATALDMADEIFGTGMVVNSATYSGGAASSGSYFNGDTVSPFAAPGDTGIILSTGNAVDFTNSDGTARINQSGGTSTNPVGGIDGDADFNALATVSVGDGMASISNINNGETQNIFNDKLADQFNTEMDGFTLTHTFTAPITPGAINTLKFGVTDVGDSGYDTNLLIAGGSFQSTIIAHDDTIIFGANDTKILDVLDNDSSTGGAFTVTHINAQAIVASDPANNSITMATGQIITLLPDGTFPIQGDADFETVYFNYLIEDAAGNTDRALVEVVQIPCFASGTTVETTEAPR